jgi:hypothetical protein
MALPVTDLGSNAEENIANAAKVLGRSKDRLKVFNAIYTGKRRVKGIAQIIKATKLSEVRALQVGKDLSVNHVVNPTKLDGRKAYEKIDFFHHHKKRILALAKSPEKLRAYPTKRNPGGAARGAGPIKIAVSIARNKQDARLVTVDDVASFGKVRKISKAVGYTKIAETKFKNGVAKILGEPGKFKDWGGESRDLASTRLEVGGKRRATAFAFKGPGKSGRLTPGKMGKNGDQIQRLMRCPAEVFLVQYWAEIDDAVLEQLEKLAQLKSFLEGRRIYYGVIDGVDSTRLINAYPKSFNQRG